MKRLLLAAAIFLPSLAQAASVVTTPLPTHLFQFTTTGGLSNPGVILGFNPQPEPPGLPYGGTLDMSHPTAPSLLLPPALGSYSVLIGLLIPGNPVRAMDPQPAPNSDGNTGFEVTFGDGSVFKIDLHIDGLIGDWASLNPQPLPPGFSALGTSFYGFTGDPMATISIFELVPNGDPLPLFFSLVPEPASMALLTLPLLATVALRRRAKS